MIRVLPEFVQNEQYYQNTRGNYRFTTLEEIRVRIDDPGTSTGLPIVFRDKNGTEWARYQDGYLIIKPNYSWDGCSPKRRFASLWIGTPDPQSTRLASLVHDVLYQFIPTIFFPWTRFQCDAAFYDLMHLSRFPLASVFHGAVRKFGGFYVADNGQEGVTSEVIKPLNE